MTLALALNVPELAHQEQNILDRLTRQLSAKWARNELRARYYDGKNALKSFNISIPPDLEETIETVVGWPEKAVDGLANRIRHDGFVIPGHKPEDLGITDMWSANRMDIEAPQAQVSSLIHSCAFLFTTLGDVKSGEPDVLLTARSALSGTGLWDPRRRRLAAALSIVAYDEAFPGQERVTELIMYLPETVITLTRDSRGRWLVVRRPHTLGRVPVEPLPFRPRLDRPFGSSRISRAVMSITDEAVRTVLRTEVGAEFYGPQRYLLGASPEAFEDATGRKRTGWEAIMGRILAIGLDENGEKPEVGTFPQMSMQPHIEHLRSAAARFSAATNLPLSSLGVTTDNPASAEAIHATKEDLLIEAESAAEVFGAAYCNAIRTGMQLRDRLAGSPDVLKGLRVNWRDPATPSRASAADAVLKTVSAFPWLADSEVALEQLGWDETKVARALADKRAAAELAPRQPSPPPLAQAAPAGESPAA